MMQGDAGSSGHAFAQHAGSQLKPQAAPSRAQVLPEKLMLDTSQAGYCSCLAESARS